MVWLGRYITVCLGITAWVSACGEAPNSDTRDDAPLAQDASVADAESVDAVRDAASVDAPIEEDTRCLLFTDVYTSGRADIPSLARLRVLSLAGQVRTLAGAESSFAMTDGALWRQGRFASVGGLHVDAASIHVVDPGAQVVRTLRLDGTMATSVAALGLVTAALHQQGWIGVLAERPLLYRQVYAMSSGSTRLLAGTAEPGFAGDGGPAVLARLNRPTGLATGTDQSIYIADTGNDRVRKLSPDGTINTIAGGGRSFVDGGQATAVRLEQPEHLYLDEIGRLFMTTATGVIRLNRDGSVTAVAGGGSEQLQPGEARLATSLRLGRITSVTTDRSGNVYVAYSNVKGHIMKIDPAGTARIVAGAASPPLEAGNLNDGPAMDVTLGPQQLALIDCARVQ